MMRIVIADDQRLFRENLKTVIELSLEEANVVGLAGNGAEAIEQVRLHKPDLLILDINMPVMDGIECLRALRESKDTTKVLLLTIFEEEQYVVEAIRLGISGYMLKDSEPELLVNYIRNMRDGCVMLQDEMAKRIVSMTAPPKSETSLLPKGLEGLTKRELDVLRRIGYGEDNQEIARHMHLSEGTIRNYVSSIYEKLELKDRSQAIRLAIYSGII